jgi:YMGG-like Gly-zipper
MKIIRQFLATSLMASLTILAIGHRYTVSAQRDSYRPGNAEIGQLLRRIDQESTQFRASLYAALERSRLDGSVQEDNINEFVRNFESAAANLRDRFRQGSDVTAETREVLNRAVFINRFMNRHQLSQNAEQDWARLRTDLDQLARYYNVESRWDNGPSSPGSPYDNRPGSPYDNRNRLASRLTGTYSLDATRSDRVGRVAKIATRGMSTDEQQRARDMLSRRLEAPEMLAIDRQGRSITIASTRGPQLTFEADGRDRIEQTPRGRTIRVNTSIVGDRLTVSSTGDRGNDYTVTFDPVNNGRELRVTRRIETDNLTEPVVANSYYTKTSDVAQLDLYREDTRFQDRAESRVTGADQIIATLDNPITTRQARESDRFTMTVQSPPELRGAVIEGYLGRVDRSGKIAGRAEVAMNFERIRLRNGSTQNFAGYIESVRTLNGEDVRVNNEGVVSEQDSQTTRTATRTGIGAALGAVIGAIAGGGKGAAIGAAIGAGTGAGSVFVQGRDDLELNSGTEFVIRSNLPRYGLRSR